MILKFLKNMTKKDAYLWTSLFDPNDSLPHKIFWVIIKLICYIYFVYSVITFRTLYMQNIIVTDITSNSHLVKTVPFPAVTICDNNKVSMKEFKNINDLLLTNDVNQSEIDDFARSLRFLISFSAYDYVETYKGNYTNIFKILRENNYTVESIMLEVQTKCVDLIKFCALGFAVKTNCVDMFKMIKTVEGFCCSMNYAGFQSTKSSNALEDKNTIRYFYLGGAGAIQGLNAFININKTDYMSPLRPFVGVTVLVADSIDYQDIMVKMTTVQVNTSAEIKIKPVIIDSDDSIRKLHPNQRYCSFPNDFINKDSIYSYYTCISKCRAEYFHKICGCVPFFFLNISEDFPNNVRECELSDLECINTNKAMLNGIHHTKYNRNDSIPCDCWPECSDRQYNVIISKDDLAEKLTRMPSKKIIGGRKINAYISVFFEKNTCLKLKSYVYMSWNDLVAIDGGILNLCLGGSILKVLEFVYEVLIKKYISSRKSNNSV